MRALFLLDINNDDGTTFVMLGSRAFDTGFDLWFVRPVSVVTKYGEILKIFSETNARFCHRTMIEISNLSSPSQVQYSILLNELYLILVHFFRGNEDGDAPSV